MCGYHRRQSDHGVHDDLDEANEHADVGDPGDDGGDRDDGVPRNPESDDEESEDAEQIADGHDGPRDEISHSWVSDQVKDCRMNQESIHHQIDTGTDHRCPRQSSIRHDIANQESLCPIRVSVDELVRDDSDGAYFFGHYLFGDHPTGAFLQPACHGHHPDMPGGSPRTAASYDLAASVHRTFYYDSG